MPSRTRQTVSRKPAPESEPTMTAPTTEAPATEAPKRTRRPKVSPNLDVQIEAVHVVTGRNPFARASYSIPDDHPVAQLFTQSLEHEVALDVTTGDPASVVALLRRIAAEKNRGVRFDKQTLKHISKDGGPYDGVLSFQAMSKRATGRGRKAKPASTTE